MATTTNYNFNKPTVGGSQNTWGADLNANWDSIDAILSGSTSIQPNLIAGAWQVGGVAITASAADINNLSNLSNVTATSAELNVLDGITASTTELNYVDGATSNIQTQLNGKAATGITISAGGGLTGGGSLSANRTISHAATSSQASVNNSGGNFIQDISVDTYGHITGISTASISSGFSASAGTNGYVTLPNGIKLQWGQVYVPANSLVTVNFPSAFSSSCFNVQTTINQSTAAAGNKSDFAFVSSLTTTSFRIKIGIDYSYTVYWFAVGY